MTRDPLDEKKTEFWQILEGIPIPDQVGLAINLIDRLISDLVHRKAMHHKTMEEARFEAEQIDVAISQLAHFSNKVVETHGSEEKALKGKSYH